MQAKKLGRQLSRAEMFAECFTDSSGKLGNSEIADKLVHILRRMCILENFGFFIRIDVSMFRIFLR
jgi:hypothetical protein